MAGDVFYHARPAGSERDVILLLGTEPNYRWRTFGDLVTGLAADHGVELVVSLGSLLADVPHTRPSPVTGSANDRRARRAARPLDLPLRGPDRHRRRPPRRLPARRAPVGSLWAAVPHYVSLTPSPRAAKALCERLATLLHIDIDVAELEEASESYARQVSEAVAADADTAGYVEELEQRADALEEADDLPSGDALAAELTRFLRERDEDDGDAARGGQ